MLSLESIFGESMDELILRVYFYREYCMIFGVLLLVCVVVALFFIFRSKLKQRKKRSEEWRKIELKRKMGFFQRKSSISPNKDLLILGDFSKDFFKKYLREDKELTFEELAKKLEEKNKRKIARVARVLDREIYSGNSIGIPGYLVLRADVFQVIKNLDFEEFIDFEEYDDALFKKQLKRERKIREKIEKNKKKKIKTKQKEKKDSKKFPKEISKRKTKILRIKKKNVKKKNFTRKKKNKKKRK